MRDLGAEVPIDPRTIMKRSRSRPDSEEFHHFGLINGLSQNLEKGISSKVSTIQIMINIDGIPLWKSSPISFWPILARVVNSNDKRPFPVSIHCGRGEPKCVVSYLEKFVDELLLLEREGLLFKRKHYIVKLLAVVCDTPARKFVKRTKGHCGEGSCDRCIQAGRSDGVGRWIFEDLNSKLRTNESFRAQTNKNHHHDRSPLEQLNLDMVRSFPLDYMHLVCLGVVRKLLFLIAGELSTEEKTTFDDRLAEFNNRCSSEFARRGRPLRDLNRWKAVEFRYFLLYAGPIVLKGLISEEQYNNFLLLHTAISLLVSPSLNRILVEFSRGLLRNFVFQFGEIHGKSKLVFNVHSLIHLADDCDFFEAPLDSFSCFPFENYLGYMKGLLRGRRFPLAQIKNSLGEFSNFPDLFPDSLVINRGNLQNLKPNSKNDRYCMIGKDVVIRIHGIDKAGVRGKQFSVSVDEYGQPLNLFEVKDFELKSHLMDILVLDGLEGEMKKWPLSVFQNAVKCIVVKYQMDENEPCKYLSIPLIHNKPRRIDSF